ncbi:hypothetical protein ACHWQZ_G005097 [Mnemiopsis leidyi]
MRAVLIFAILGIAYASQAKGLCLGVDDTKIDDLFRNVRIGALAILGESCPSFDIDGVFLESKQCKHLVRQATCYSIKAAKLYDVPVVSYALLMSDVPNMEKLGNLACKKTKGCFENIKSAIEVCLENNANFIDDTMRSAEELFRTDQAASVAEFAKKNKGSIFGDLVNMAMDQFSSAQDIRTFFESQLTESVEEDITTATEKAKTLAQDWCDSECTSKTASFLRGIFSEMHGGDCTDASVFCGACQERAHGYFDVAGNQLPCCVDTVVQNGIQAYEYIIENYGDEIDQFAESLKNHEAMTEDGLTEAEEILDNLKAEFDCVSDVRT